MDSTKGREAVGKPEVERSIGRLRLGCADNIKMDRTEVVLGDMDCIGLAQDRNQ
jgi:hypothetical protein